MLSTVNRHLVTRRHKVTGPESPSLFFSLSPGQRQRSVQFFWSRWPPSSSTRREYSRVDRRALAEVEGSLSAPTTCRHRVTVRWAEVHRFYAAMERFSTDLSSVHTHARAPPRPTSTWPRPKTHTDTRTKKKKPRLWITSHRRIFTSTLSHQSRSFMTI